MDRHFKGTLGPDDKVEREVVDEPGGGRAPDFPLRSLAPSPRSGESVQRESEQLPEEPKLVGAVRPVVLYEVQYDTEDLCPD